jgi:hypothetical protein
MTGGGAEKGTTESDSMWTLLGDVITWDTGWLAPVTFTSWTRSSRTWDFDVAAPLTSCHNGRVTACAGVCDVSADLRAGRGGDRCGQRCRARQDAESVRGEGTHIHTKKHTQTQKHTHTHLLAHQAHELNTRSQG